MAQRQSRQLVLANCKRGRARRLPTLARFIISISSRTTEARLAERKVQALDSIRSVDYTVLICGDLPLTTAFYRDVLKFPIEIERESWVSFRVGSSILALRSRTVKGGFEDGPHTVGAASVQLAFRVPPSKLDACYRELVRQQVPIVCPPKQLPNWGHHMFLFRDPEGNLLEIFAEM